MTPEEYQHFLDTYKKYSSNNTTGGIYKKPYLSFLGNCDLLLSEERNLK
ncbi:MAG: hypothetical protein ACXVLQ_11375 [Bacteriovorax sp.]